jgi:hypothetical protein
MHSMTCPLCGTRKARRSCPALGKSICPVCCGTKRLTEIHCPPDCAYLASAREHPPVAAKRQQQNDTSRLVHAMRDLNRNQSRLFLSVNAYISQYRPPDIQPLIDADVIEAVVALADTFDTAARGLIYDHRPASRQGERLVSALKPLLDEAIRAGGSAVQRDAAVVLRRIAESAGGTPPPDSLAGRRRTDFLELLSRVFRPRPPGEAGRVAGDADEGPRLIVP